MKTKYKYLLLASFITSLTGIFLSWGYVEIHNGPLTKRWTLEGAADHVSAQMNTGLSGKVVTLVLVDLSVFDLFYNYYRSAKQVGVTNILPIALNKKTYLRLTSLGITSYYDKSTENIQAEESGFLSPSFKKKGAQKFIGLAKLLRLNFSVLLSDVDIVFYKNPYELFNCKDCDFEVSSEWEPEDIGVNVGFCFFRPHKKTLTFIDTLLRILETDKSWDQAVFGQLMRQGTASVKYKYLPYRKIPNGSIQHNYKVAHDTLPLNNNSISLTPRFEHTAYTFHATGSGRALGKMHRLRDLGKMVLSNKLYYTDTSAKYLIYENPFKDLAGQDWKALENALELSSKLNRILILPLFYCSPKPRVPRPGCTISDILRDKLDRFDDKLRMENTREPWFLKNPSVPTSVKESISPTLFIYENSTRNLLSRVSQTEVEQFEMNGDAKDKTKLNLLHYLDKYSSFSVLRFHSLYFKL